MKLKEEVRLFGKFLLDEHWQALVDTHSAVSRAEIEEAAKEVLV